MSLAPFRCTKRLRIEIKSFPMKVLLPHQKENQDSIAGVLARKVFVFSPKRPRNDIKNLTPLRR